VAQAAYHLSLLYSGLLAAVARLLASMPDCAPAIAVQNINARLRGFELDAFAAWLAEIFVETAALEVVVGNPPFGKVRLPAEQRTRFSRSLFGHANLYGVFTDLAIGLARAGGLVSFLTPSSFLAGEYFKNLRGNSAGRRLRSRLTL
jgi:adenine-specific DNA-methyltransferase